MSRIVEATDAYVTSLSRCQSELDLLLDRLEEDFAGRYLDGVRTLP